MDRNKLLQKWTYGAIIYLLLIVILTFTPVQGFFPLCRQTWIFLTIGVVASIFLTPSYYKTRALFFLIIYFFVIVLNSLVGDVYFHNIIRDVMEIYLLLLPSVMFYYAVTRPEGLYFCKWAVIAILTIIIIETFASYNLVTDTPAIIRELHHESLETGQKNDYLYPFFCLGLSNYSLPHAVPMLIPPLVMLIRRKEIKISYKVFFLISLISTIVLIWLSGSMTALMIGFFIFVISFLSVEGKQIFRQRKIIVITLLMIPVVFSDEIKIYILDFLENLFDSNKYFYDKILEFKASVISGQTTGDMEKREDLYSLSFSNLLNNLLIGTNTDVGNHSTILDRLAVLGFLGFLPLFYFCYYQFKMMMRHIPFKERIFLYESILAGIMMLLSKDMDDWESFLILFAIAPMIMLPFSSKKNFGIHAI